MFMELKRKIKKGMIHELRRIWKQRQGEGRRDGGYKVNETQTYFRPGYFHSFILRMQDKDMHCGPGELLWVLWSQCFY